MRKSRFTTEQIIGFIKQAAADLSRQHGFSPAPLATGRCWNQAAPAL